LSVVTDWTAIARDVAEHIYGSPNPRLSNSKELRFGRKGSKALRLDTGIFVDFEDDKKGRGVLALVEHTQGLDRAGALEWLQSKGFLSERRNSASHRAPRLANGISRESRRLLPRPARPRDVAQAANTDHRRKVTPAEIITPRFGADDRQVAGWQQIERSQAAKAWLANKIGGYLPPYPSGLGFVPRESFEMRRALGRWVDQPGLVGAVCAIAAPIDDWIQSAPNHPVPTALAFVGIDIGGGQVGVSKRTFGHMREAVFIAGVELLEDTPLDAMVVGVCEGIADALAIRKLEGIPAIACCSTPHPSRAPDLARFGGVQVYTDVGEGERQAGELATGINLIVGSSIASIRRPLIGKDAADVATATERTPNGI
jgi:hypothetical protein